MANTPLQPEEIPLAPRRAPRLRRILGYILMGAIFAWMIKPVIVNWKIIQPFIAKTDALTFFTACGIFTIFLFARSLIWRRILKGFHHDLPLAPTTRIWISSELARYVPGSILQFIGRVTLAKPYGVPRGIVITSQILELAAFLLGNVILAVVCLLFDVGKIDHEARPWMILAILLVPLLATFLHPKIFYWVINAVRARGHKDPIEHRLSGRVLTALLFGSLVALVWQSIAIWLLTHEALHLAWQHWWYVAGAYCLAWIAGFLSFLSPGGLGVRELVFYVTLRAILPTSIKDQFGANRDTLNAYLQFLPFLLRIWTIVGELLLWSIASLIDLPGALGRTDAPGRVNANSHPTAEKKQDQDSEAELRAAPNAPAHARV